MGCWSESCAITGYPILPNQEVLMTIPKPHYKSQFSSNSFGWHEVWKKVSYVGFGSYNDYGWINEITKEQFHELYESEITDKESIERPDFRSVFIHKNVVLDIIKLYPLEESKKEIAEAIDCSIEKLLAEKYKSNPDLYETMRPKACLNLEYLISVIKFTWKTRINLGNAYSFKGSQTIPDKKHWNLLMKMMKKQQANYDKLMDSY